MKILLIYPEMPVTFWTMNYLLKIAGKRASYPPLGLLTVAALLPEAWEKRLVDLNVAELTDADLAWADYVFVGAMNVQAASAREVIARCRKAGVKVVAGGTLFTHEYEQFDEVDYFVLNEAEITLPQFLADLENGCPKRVYTSLEFANVHETPVPMWELADLRQYEYAIVQYSRGCPYQCDFCDVTALFGRRPRTKTPEQIIAELNALGDLRRFDLLLFADDNLIGNKKLLKTELLPALIEWRKREKITVGFATQVTINLVDDSELMQLMLEAGFRHIFIGIETPEEDSLLASKKKQNAKRNLMKNVQRLHEAGFIVTGGFIVGFDTDTPAIFENQIDFIQESGILVPIVNILKAPPGTELHDRMKKEGRLIEPFDFDETRTNIIPKMDPDVLHKGYGDVLKETLLPKGVYERAKNFLQDYQEPKVENPLFSGLFNFRYIGVASRIFWHIGILGKERRYCWKLLLWSLFHRPKLLDVAFLCVVLMYQFRNMYENYEEVNSE
jgi:radical SAM superfamily enzyme YgiQ (UPF0313 family)